MNFWSSESKGELILILPSRGKSHDKTKFSYENSINYWYNRPRW